MLRVTKQAIEETKTRPTHMYENKDIIVEKSIEIESVREDGVKEIKTKKIEVNLTKKINETARVFKRNQAEEKLAELEKIFSK